MYNCTIHFPGSRVEECWLMSLVLAADYEVPDFAHWQGMLNDGLSRLPKLGARHIVVYRSIENGRRVFVTVGVRERGPVDVLLRSAALFDWFNAAGVEEIPPLFVGQVVEKFDLEPEAGTSGAPSEGAVIIAGIVSTGSLDEMLTAVHADARQLAQAGVRRYWTYQALDDASEAMILLEIATGQQAARWLRHPDPAAAWMSQAGVGCYPPLFVGRLIQAIAVPTQTTSGP
jgi:hypothetical protein